MNSVGKKITPKFNQRTDMNYSNVEKYLLPETQLELLAGRPQFSENYLDALVYSWGRITEYLNDADKRNTRNTRFIFIRHGTTLYNSTNRVSGVHNTKLTPEGEEQARSLSKGLTYVDPSAIFSSNLDRAIQTAQIYLDSIDSNYPSKLGSMGITKDFRLSEINLGQIQGQRRKHIPSFEKGDINYKPVDGESYKEASKRIASFIVDACKFSESFNVDNPTILIFCHAGVMRIVRSFFEIVTDTKHVFSFDFSNTGLLDVQSSQLNIPNYWIQESNET